MDRAGLRPTWVQGRRYTDEATLAIVARVLAEEINEDIVRHVNKFGGRAAGLHHKTHQCLYGERLALPGAEGPIDLGRVGEVVEVDTPPIENLCLAGVVPVLPSLAEAPDGGLLNVNADTAAAAVARALRADKLVFLTDTPGILMDRADPKSLVRGLTPDGCRDLIARGVIDSGMIPKVEACLASLQAGVQKTHIVDGRLRHSLLLEMYTEEGIGTEIVPRSGEATRPPRPLEATGRLTPPFASRIGRTAPNHVPRPGWPRPHDLFPLRSAEVPRRGRQEPPARPPFLEPDPCLKSPSRHRPRRSRSSIVT